MYFDIHLDVTQHVQLVLHWGFMQNHYNFKNASSPDPSPCTRTWYRDHKYSIQCAVC